MTAEASTALRFQGVSKRYGRGPRALDQLSFTIPRGTVAGFVGHNGAGKTTSFAIVSGYLLPDEGEVDILGRGPHDPHALKGLLGVLPQDAALPERHTPFELLVHLGMLQGLAPRRARGEADRVLGLVQLSDRAKDRIGALSHGMRRRVAVATALCGAPELVLLDEPLAGLDPMQAHTLRDALAGLRGKHTLVVSSHNLAELERLCDWVVMLKGGRCMREGTMQEVTGQGQMVRWQLGPGEVPLVPLSLALPEHELSLQGRELVQQAPPGENLDAATLVVMRHLLEAGVAVRAVSRGMALEQRFIDDVEQAAGA